MSKNKVKTVEQGIQHAENAINKVLEEFQTFDSTKFSSFRERVEYFSQELSCYLFFDKTVEDIVNTNEGKLGMDVLNEILDDISKFIAKIGSLYVKITDFDGDGKPILDITKAQFNKVNGKYVISLDDVLDYDDVNTIKNKIEDFSDAVKAGDTGAAVTVAIESIMGIIQYSLAIYQDVKDMNIGDAFKDIFTTLKNYPNTVSKNFRFKTVPAMATSLVFSGIMLFTWIGIAKIPNANARDTVTQLLKNSFVKNQIHSTVDLIVRAIQGEDLTDAKICGCIPLCCKGDKDLQKVNRKLQDDLDALISMTESQESVHTPPTPSPPKPNRNSDVRDENEESKTGDDRKILSI